MTISLCMIAKDEEKFIEKSLNSVVDFVDEIIIVDTGSKDKTIEVAKNFTNKILESPWKKDFSYHRNNGIKEATCDWILFLDCDEILLGDGKGKAKEILKNLKSPIKGYNLSVTNIISNAEVYTFPSLRLFRNFEGFSFSGKVHEQIIPSIQKKYGANSLSSLPLKIHHYGYEEAIIKEKNKNKRNLEILLSIEDKDAYLYGMLGDEYLRGNDLHSAVRYYEKSFMISGGKCDDLTLLVNYISSLINLKHYDKALNLIKLVQTSLPNFIDLYFFEFWIYFYSNNFSSALTSLDKYISFLNSNSPIVEVKKFYNIYNLNELRQKTISTGLAFEHKT